MWVDTGAGHRPCVVNNTGVSSAMRSAGRARGRRRHRRAVAPRAARARDTVIAGCGIGPHAAGGAVISVSAHSPRDAGRNHSAYRRIPTATRDARGARYNNPTLPSEGRTSRNDGARSFPSVPTASNAVDMRSAWSTMMRLCVLDGPSLRRKGAANRVARDTARWAATVVLKTDRCGRAECYHSRIGDATGCFSCDATRVCHASQLVVFHASQIVVRHARRVGKHHRRKCVSRAHCCRKWSQEMTDAVRIVAH